MHFMRGKAGIFLVLACLAVITAVIWYCLFDMNRHAQGMQGTFVRVCPVEEERVA